MPTRTRSRKSARQRNFDDIARLENAYRVIADYNNLDSRELLINPTPYDTAILGDNIPLGGTTAIPRALTKVLTGVKEKRLSGLPFYDDTVIPSDDPIELSDREVTSLFMEGQAGAEFIGPKTKNLLNSSMSVGEDKYPVRVCANSYVVHYVDQAGSDKALSMAGMSSLVKRADITRRGIAEVLNNYGAFGDGDIGLTGFINNAGVTEFPASTYNPYTGTAQQDLDFFADQVSFIVNNQNLNNTNIVAYVPYNVYVAIAKKRDDTLRRSVLGVILEDVGLLGLEAIIPLNECQRGANSTNLPDNVGTAGRDRIVFTVRDSMFYSKSMTPLGQWPQVQMTTGYEVPLYQAATPCMFHNVTGSVYVDINPKP